jgi:hypothetical protein
MAAKKRSKKKHHHGRRVGALKMPGGFEQLFGVIGGVVLTKVAKKFIPTTINDKIIAGVEAVGGAVLSNMTKSAFLKGIGYGISAGGVVTGLQSFGIITGVGGGVGKPIVFKTTADGRSLMGFREVPKVGNASNGFPNPSALGRRKVNMANLYAGIYG